jgi:hypothetical protein
LGIVGDLGVHGVVAVGAEIVGCGVTWDRRSV